MSIAAAGIGLLAIGGSLACRGSDRIEKVAVEEEPPATGVEQPGFLTIRGRVVDAESEAGIEISGTLPRGNDHTVTDPAVVHLESIALEPE